MRAERSSSAQK